MRAVRVIFFGYFCPHANRAETHPPVPHLPGSARDSWRWKQEEQPAQHDNRTPKSKPDASAGVRSATSCAATLGRTPSWRDADSIPEPSCQPRPLQGHRTRSASAARPAATFRAVDYWRKVAHLMHNRALSSRLCRGTLALPRQSLPLPETPYVQNTSGARTCSRAFQALRSSRPARGVVAGNRCTVFGQNRTILHCAPHHVGQSRERIGDHGATARLRLARLTSRSSAETRALHADFSLPLHSCYGNGFAASRGRRTDWPSGRFSVAVTVHDWMLAACGFALRLWRLAAPCTSPTSGTDVASVSCKPPSCPARFGRAKRP